MSDAYPANFADWPLDRRNAFFVDAARAYDERLRGSGEVEPAHAPKFAIVRSAPPPQSEGNYGSGWAPSAPFEDAEPPLEDGAHAAPASPTFKRVINPADWEGKPVPSRKWIVPDIIPDETVTLLSGDGAGGKSLLALQLGAARALGKEWIGLLPEPGRTLILSAEDDSDEMQRRLDDIRKFYGARMADLADMRLVDLVGEDSVLGELMKGRILPTQMYRALDAFAADFKPGLVVLDVLADVFAGDENSRPQAREFIGLLKRLSRTHKCAILLLAHPSLNGMATGNGTSGSTAWSNSVRSRLYLQGAKASDGSEPDKNLRVLEAKKSNYGPADTSITLEWKNGLFVPVQGPVGLDKLALEAKVEDAFLTILKRFNQNGRNASDTNGTSYAPRLFVQEPEAKGVTREQFAAAMRRLFVADKIRKVNHGRPSRPAWTMEPGE
jgi:RecA-family ATPase